MKPVKKRESLTCEPPMIFADLMPTFVITLLAIDMPRPAEYVCAGLVRVPAVMLMPEKLVNLIVSGVWSCPLTWKQRGGLGILDGVLGVYGYAYSRC